MMNRTEKMKKGGCMAKRAEKVKWVEGMTKRAGVLTIAAMMAVSLVGCGSKESSSANTGTSNEAETYTEKYMSNDETINYENSAPDLKLKAKIKPSPEEIPEVKLTFYEPDEKAVVKELLDEGMRTEWEEDNDHPQYSGKNGDILNICKAGFNLLTDFESDISHCFHLASQVFDDYNADKYSKTTDFDFMSRQEALDLLVEKLEKCGIELGDYETSFYCLDYKTLAKEEMVWDKDGVAPKSKWKDQWTEDDNCYYICIRQKFNDIPEYHPFGASYVIYEDCNAPVQAIVSKEGIRFLEVDYVMQYENTGKMEKILSPEQVLNQVIEKKQYQEEYENNAKHKLTKMNLCYFSKVDARGYGKIFYTIPVYQCYVKDKHQVEDGTWWYSVNQLIIDARTGEEVEWQD